MILTITNMFGFHLSDYEYSKKIVILEFNENSNCYSIFKTK